MNRLSVETIFRTAFLILFILLPSSFAEKSPQWHLPEGAKARLGKGWISGEIAYSPDGTRLAVSSSVGIWIYDTDTYAEVTLFIGHTEHVNSVAFSPDGQTLISGGEDSTVRVWNVLTGQLLHTLENHNDGVDDVAFSPDGKMFGSIDGEKEIRLWDADTIGLLHTLRSDSRWWGSVGSVNCLAFSYDSKMVAGGYYHGSIGFWDVNTGKYLSGSDFTVHWGVNTLAFSSDGVTLAMGSGNNGVYLLGARTGQHWQTVGNHRGGVNSVAFSPNGKILASGGNDNKIKTWDAFTGEHLRTLEGHTDGVLGVSFSSNGHTIASVSWTEVRFWDANTGRLLHTLEGHTRSVYSVAFSPDGNILASGHQDGAIQLWDPRSEKHIHLFEGERRTGWTSETSETYSIAFSPDSSTIAGVSWDNIKLWDAHTWEPQHILKGGWARSVSFSPDGKTLASGNGGIILWDFTTGERKQTLGGSGRVRSVSFSPDGQLLVSATQKGIYLWHVRTERRLRTLMSDGSYSVVFSPNGDTIAGGVGDEIWIWNTSSGERLKRLTGHKDRYNIFSISFSPDGNTIASGSADSTIRLWDATTGANKQTLIEHTDSVISVSFSPDGSTLASGSSDGTVLLWDLAPSDTTGDTPSTPATSDATVSILATPVQSAIIGELLTFPLNITEGENVAGYQATLEFDTTALQYVKSANGDYLPSGAFFVPPVVDGNKVTLAATSLSGASNGDGTLATLTFELVALKSSTLKLSEVSLVDSDGVRSSPQIEDTEVEIIEASRLAEDVNEDGVVNILDLVAVASNFGQIGENIADVNEDGVVDIVDLVLVAGALGSNAAAPSAWHLSPEDVPTKTDVQQWISQAQQLNLTDATSQRGIRFLENLLAALTPKETVLLPNYPNPFNPETWIPYQLAEPADVSVLIYTMDGKLVRTLNLGHQSIGIYQGKSRAAYWDGRNALGEQVASGIYFYQLETDEMSSMRKMVILK